MSTRRTKAKGFLVLCVLCMLFLVRLDYFRRAALKKQPQPRNIQNSNALLNVATAITGQDVAVVSQNRLVYKFPKRRLQESTGVVVGVLSTATHVSSRQLIRETWGNNIRTIVFLLAGNWTQQIEDEMMEHQDLIWVDGPEIYRGLTYKTGVFFSAVHSHAPGYTHVFKTDDDCFAGLDDLLGQLEQEPHSEVDYMGMCYEDGVSPVIRHPNHQNHVSKQDFSRDFYPSYASGWGYVVSRRAMECFVPAMSVISFVANEDAATGLLAERCNITCVSSLNFFYDAEPAPFLRCELKEAATLYRQQAIYCRDRPASIACSSFQGFDSGSRWAALSLGCFALMLAIKRIYRHVNLHKERRT